MDERCSRKAFKTETHRRPYYTTDRRDELNIKKSLASLVISALQPSYVRDSKHLFYAAVNTKDRDYMQVESLKNWSKWRTDKSIVDTCLVLGGYAPIFNIAKPCDALFRKYVCCPPKGLIACKNVQKDFRHYVTLFQIVRSRAIASCSVCVLPCLKWGQFPDPSLGCSKLGSSSNTGLSLTPFHLTTRFLLVTGLKPACLQCW